MAFFGGFFEDDPLMSGHLRQMNQFFEGYNMFGNLRHMQQSLMPLGFPPMNSMMMGMNNPNCLSYHSSTFTAMTNGPDGQPQIYRSSQSTRTAPGGLKETKKSVCDSRTGTKRLAIGRHIGDRGHVRERVQNFRSGEREDSEDFINLEEEQAADFNREWQRKTHGREHSAVEYGQQQQLALPEAPYEAAPDRLGVRRVSPSPRRYYPGSSSASPIPIIEEPDDDDDVVVIRREKSRKRRRDEPNNSGSKPTKRNAQR